MSSKLAMPEKIQNQIIPYLAPKIRGSIANLSAAQLEQLEEIRLRLGKPLSLHMMKSEMFLGETGKLSRLAQEGYLVTEDDIVRTLAAVSGNSVYALEEELRRGFITIRGGHRIGLAGKTILEGGQIKSMKDFSGLAVRVARELPGCGNVLLDQIMADRRIPYNTLIISPPRCGKTTLLRDLARQLGNELNVAVIDERSELAGCFRGEPQLDVGAKSDVLEGCPKALGIGMAIRALAPEVLITDEIGRYEDVEAVEECLNAGVKIISTAHAKDIEDLKRRPVMQEIFKQQSFEIIVILSRRKGPGTIEKLIRLD